MRNSHLNSMKYNYFKYFKKTVSVFVVFLLLSTVIATVVSSKNFSLGDKSESEQSESILETKSSTNYSSISERLYIIKQKLLNFRENLKNKLSRIKSILDELKKNRYQNVMQSRSTFLQSVRTYVGVQNSKSGFLLKTTYDNKLVETKLRLFLPVKVDVDDDGDNDIKAQLLIYPSIKKPFSLVCNLKLKIVRLEGFEDNFQNFEAYVEFYFPGLIIKKNQGDIVRFGYHSPKGEEVPDVCNLTYTYAPHILSKEKPQHDLTLGVGSADSSSDISLIYSYANSEGENYYNKDFWTISFSPAVNSHVSFVGVEDAIGRKFSLDNSKASFVTIHRTKIVGNNVSSMGLIVDKVTDFSFETSFTPFSQGGGNIEYERTSDASLNITLFVEKDSATFFYIDELPKHVQFHWNPALNGFIEFNSYDERIARIGIRNALYDKDATSKAWVDNLPSIAKVQWNWSILNEFKFELYTDASGCAAYLISDGFLGSNASIQASFTTKTNFDFSLYWNFADGYLRVNRSNKDLGFGVKLRTDNKTSFGFSGEIKNTVTSPFEIYFDQLLDGNSTIVLSSSNLEISHLNIELFLENFGRVYLEMAEFRKTTYGTVTTNFSFIEQSENILQFNFTLDVDTGIYIKGLAVGINENHWPLGDVNETGPFHLDFGTTVVIDLIDIWISEDRLMGYISISGSAVIDFNTYYKNESGIVICQIGGTIEFDTQGREFNISWRTEVGGKDKKENVTYYNIDGSACLGLSDFNLWVMDKIDISIPYFAGKFEMGVSDDKFNTAKLTLYLDNASLNFNWNTSFRFNNLFNMSFSSHIQAELESYLDGYIVIMFNESGITSIRGNGSVSLAGILDITELYLKLQSQTDINIIKIRGIRLSGGLIFEADLTNSSFSLKSVNTVLTINNFYYEKNSSTTASVVNEGISTLSFDRLQFYADGYITFDKSKLGEVVPDSEVFSVEIDGSASIGLYNLYLDMPSKNVNLSLNFIMNLALAGILKLFVYYDEPDTKYKDPTGNVTTIPYKFEASLDEGFVSIDNFFFGLNNGQLNINCTQLYLKASLDLDIERDLDTKTINIKASGEGLFRIIGGLISFGINKSTDSEFVGNKDAIEGSASLGLMHFEIELDDFKGSIVDLKLDTENITNSSVESFAMEGAITNILLNGLELNAKFANSTGNFSLDIQQLSLNFLGSGLFYIKYENKQLNINIEVKGESRLSTNLINLRFEYETYIIVEGMKDEEHWINLTIYNFNMAFIGATSFSVKNVGEIFYINGSIYDKDANININFLRFDYYDNRTNASLGKGFMFNLILEEFYLSGATTFTLNFYAEFEKGNLFPKDFQLLVGCNSNWSAKLISVSWNMLRIENLQAEGSLSAGLTNGLKGIDFVIALNGNWRVGEIWLLKAFYIDKLSIIGDAEFYFDDDFVLAMMFFMFDTNLTIEDIISYVLMMTDSMIKIITNEDTYIDFFIRFETETKPITPVHIDDIVVIEGEYLISWDVLGSNGTGYLIIDTPDASNLNLSMDIIDIFNVNLDRGDMNIAWDINFDGDGYFAIDNNNEWTTRTIKFANLFELSASFKADNFNISWDWSNNWWEIIKKTGSIDFDIGFLKIYKDGVWYQLIPLDGTYIYISEGSSYKGPYSFSNPPTPNRTDLNFTGEKDVSYTFNANHPSAHPLWPDTSVPDPTGIKAYQWSRETDGPPVVFPWHIAAVGQNIEIEPIDWYWGTEGKYNVTLKIKDQNDVIYECIIKMHIYENVPAR